ncbi:sensor histidine kinase [Heliorestis convoluta]|uniref:histidine kinase n=1 Tax=Heliorestis convoluta TaxID=356322 RepID=A0A5Q2N1C7_9FIRM|nr:ATP-binding protein [Heliorestis convoluta]QGG48607.1 PAS domain S-box protein [Heliorestis convoluta]
MKDDNIFKDLTVLYEMALSIGQSLDLEKNCDNFLKILMARKNLSFASVWIREDKIIPQGEKNNLLLTYGKPRYFVRERIINECEQLRDFFQGRKYLPISYDNPYFRHFVHENNIKGGTYVIFPLADLGYLKLYTMQNQLRFFEEREINQLEKVMKKFAISLEGCLSHQKLVIEIAERKKAEQELSTLNETLAEKIEQEVTRSRQKDIILQRHARQAAMGEIINSIAHQWRQPLNSISLAASNILLDLELEEDPEEIKKSCDFILKLTEDMSNTITDFMDFFRHDKEKSEVLIEDIFQDIAGMLQAQLFSHNIMFTWQVEAGLRMVTYKKELQQILLNLITNSIQAFKDRSLLEKRVEARVHKDGSYIIELRDNAGGIPEEIIEKIFNPYFTTKEKGQGTGLGLSICKSIVEDSLRGEISVCNEGEGAFFRIKLPTDRDFLTA